MTSGVMPDAVQWRRRAHAVGLTALLLLAAPAVLPAESEWAPSTDETDAVSASLDQYTPQDAAAPDEATIDVESLEAFTEILSLKPGEIRTVPVHELRRVAIGDPTIVDVTIVSADELLLQAKAPGTTNLLIWDDTGQHATTVEVVDEAPDKLETQLHQLLAEMQLSQVRLKREQSKFFLVGEVASQQQLDQLDEMLSAYREQVTNLVAVPAVPAPSPAPTVKLTVQLVEMTRDDTDKLGVDWSDTVTFTETTFGVLGPNNVSIPARLGEAFRLGALSRTGVTQVLNMLITQGKARILAEPQLVASSGKEATTILGVEVPVITASSVSAGTVTQNIEFKKTGVELKFRPTVLEGPDQPIALTIDAKVSSVDKTVAITVSGVVVPGFKVRHTQTEIITNPGQTVFISGLLQDEEKKNLSQVPGVGSIPILGNLFRSNEFVRGKTELIMTVTPDLAPQAEPKPESEPKPAPAVEQHPPAAEVPGAAEDPRLRYALQIQERIATSLRYPESVKAEGRSGQLRLRLHVLRDGTLGEASVAEPSGSEALDAEALHAARSQSPYPPFPADLPQQDLWVDVPIFFRP